MIATGDRESAVLGFTSQAYWVTLSDSLHWTVSPKFSVPSQLKSLMKNNLLKGNLEQGSQTVAPPDAPASGFQDF